MDKNIYYNPESFGLSVVAQIDYSSGYYEFDIRVVWKDKAGKLWTARDHGCSCPTPFEDYHLGNISPLDLRELVSECRAELSGYNSDNVSPRKVQDFLYTVRMAVLAQKQETTG